MKMSGVGVCVGVSLSPEADEETTVPSEETEEESEEETVPETPVSGLEDFENRLCVINIGKVLHGSPILYWGVSLRVFFLHPMAAFHVNHQKVLWASEAEEPEPVAPKMKSKNEDEEEEEPISPKADEEEEEEAGSVSKCGS
eukprot:Skav204603  [mRNA]  locus=scaffold1712:12444:13214:+ [translate_table: standard]